MLPGGGLWANENPLKSAQRELKEETGKDIPADRFEEAGTVLDKSDDRIYHVFRVILLQSEYREQVPPHREFEEFRWVAPQRIPWDEMLPEHREWLPQMLFTPKPLVLRTKRN